MSSTFDQPSNALDGPAGNHTILNFAQDIQQEVIARSEMPDEEEFRETIFTRIMAEYLAEAGELEDAEVCYFSKSVGTTSVKINGYALSENEESLDLIVTLFLEQFPPATAAPINIRETFKQAVNFFNIAHKASPAMLAELEESSPAFQAIQRIAFARATISRVRILLLTDGILSGKGAIPKDQDLPGLRATCQVWDMERVFRAVSSGQCREAIEIDFEEAVGEAIPCLEQPQSNPEYAAYLAIIPGRAIVEIYGRYGSRLLERNVRSFLQNRGAINRGMNATIRERPHMFLAFNNGLSATAERVQIVDLPNGGKGIKAVHDLQIVNGGQTTASIYHAAKKNGADVSSVFVQVKLTVLKDQTHMDEVIPLISRYANSQNKVQEADLRANDAYHRSLEALSRSIWAPAKDGASRQTRWYYERARGQYQDDLARIGTTPAKRDDFKKTYPLTQLFTKTDLAKAATSWAGEPHIVSKGAQACFLNFMLKLDEHKQKEAVSEPDQRYFERMVAKLILFRAADQIMKGLKYPGYRANLVTYTVARIAYETKGWIDLSRIWREQRLSPGLEAAIGEVSKVVWTHITNPPDNGNVTQYCKRATCWEAFLKCNVFLPDSHKDALISERARGEATATVLLGKEAVKAALGISKDEWFAVYEWAKINNVLTGLQRNTLIELGAAVGTGQVPTLKQANDGLKVLKDAKALGYAGKL